MRRRDGAMTLEDYNIWKSHDILGPGNCDPDVLQRADNYRWLCAENADDGQRNVAKVRNLAETQGFPITRYDSTHINISAKRLKPGEFKGLRTVTRLAREAPVMPTRNKIYAVETVLLVLTNGARWEVMGSRHSEVPPLLSYRNTQR